MNKNTTVNKELLFAPLEEIMRVESVQKAMKVGGIFLMLSFLITGLLLSFTEIEFISYNKTFGIIMVFIGMALYLGSATIGYKTKLYDKVFGQQWKIEAVDIDTTKDGEHYLYVKTQFTDVAFLVYDKESAKFFKKYLDKILNKKPFFTP